MSLPRYNGSLTCCTCASQINTVSETEKEKPFLIKISEGKQLECCNRFICGKCLDKNPRFMEYCPYCQTTNFGWNRSSTSTNTPRLSPQTLGIQPPSYTTSDPVPSLPPPYSTTSTTDYPTNTESAEDGKPTYTDIIHHLHPTDCLLSLSLKYSVPLPILRQHNLLFSDALLHGRRVISIPRTHYSGVSLSPTPVEDPEVGTQKTKLKRFQIQAKCVEYKVAEWYLKESNWDVEEAVRRWNEDEEWERRNPNKILPSSSGGKYCMRSALTGFRTAQNKERELENDRAKSRKWGLRAFGY